VLSRAGRASETKRGSGLLSCDWQAAADSASTTEIALRVVSAIATLYLLNPAER
jgi:hypothetical protein